MKRTLYDAKSVLSRVLDPLGIFKMLNGGGGGGPAPAPAPTPEKGAGEEAARKSATEAAQRAGARSSLLTDANLSNTFGSTPTRHKSLLGG